MGQQQLILLVLAVVIVGIAIVVGIRAFTENSVRSNADAMTQDAVRIANDLQAWKQKPAPFGGQASLLASGGVTQDQVNDPADFTGANFALLGYAADAATGTYTNLNGQFRIIAAGATGATIVGVNTQQNNQVQVVVAGMTDTDITGTTQCLGGTNPVDGTVCTAGFTVAP